MHKAFIFLDWNVVFETPHSCTSELITFFTYRCSITYFNTVKAQSTQRRVTQLWIKITPIKHYHVNFWSALSQLSTAPNIIRNPKAPLKCAGWALGTDELSLAERLWVKDGHSSPSGCIPTGELIGPLPGTRGPAVSGLAQIHQCTNNHRCTCVSPSTPPPPKCPADGPHGSLAGCPNHKSASRGWQRTKWANCPWDPGGCLAILASPWN